MIDGKIIADLHTHNHYSFDANGAADDYFAAAVNAGVDIIAVTNHFDIDGVLAGIYSDYDVEADKQEVEQGKEKYAGKLRILRGIELGQPLYRPNESISYLEKHDFDYVLVSLHNLRDKPDFSLWDYGKMSDEECEDLLKEYFKEYLLLLDFPRIDTLAHLNYPYRYMKRAGRKINFKHFRDTFADVFTKLIARGTALEINTSGYRQGMGTPMPDDEIVAIYRECGGELNVVGSDAHSPQNICADFERAYELLRKLGFKYTYIPSDGGFEPRAL